MGQALCCSARDSALEPRWGLAPADPREVSELREEMERIQDLAEDMLNRVSLLMAEKEQLATSCSLLERENQALREDLEQQGLEVIEQHYRQLEEHRRQRLLEQVASVGDGGGSGAEDLRLAAGNLGTGTPETSACTASTAVLESSPLHAPVLASRRSTPKQLDFVAEEQHSLDVVDAASLGDEGPDERAEALCGLVSPSSRHADRGAPCSPSLQAFSIGSPREKLRTPGGPGGPGGPGLWVSATARAAAAAGAHASAA